MLNADQTWRRLLTFLYDSGFTIHPRGIETKEMIGYQTIIDMSRPIVTHPARKLGYKFQAAEAAWILSGDNRVETIKPFSRDIEKFSDDGVKFFGAYGPKVLKQVSYITDCLVADQDTRQAYLNIWRECPPQTKDVPCTVGVQFLIREGRLHCIDTMRSSDAWLGWPYDVFNFSMLSAMIALRLFHKHGIKVNLGSLTLTAGSQHLYAKDFAGAVRIISNGPEYQDYQTLVGFHEVYQSPERFLDRLWQAARGEGSLAWAQRGWAR